MKQSKFPQSDNGYRNACLSKINLEDEAAKKLSDWVNNPKNFLLYLGSHGCGKTYFCAAMINLLKEKNVNYLFNFERDYFSTLKGEIAKGFDTIGEIEKICDMPFVILDDMGAERDGDLNGWQKAEIQKFLDIRSMSYLPTIITSNVYVKDLINVFGERSYSRLVAKKNTILELKAQDLRQVYD